MKGNPEREAAEAHERLEVLLEGFDEALTTDEVDTQLDLAGVTEESTRDVVRAHCDLLRNRREGFLAAGDVTQLQQMPDGTALSTLAEAATKYEEEAKAFDDDARTGQKEPDLNSESIELAVMEMVIPRESIIVEEVSRAKEVYRLEEARKLANTKALSDKKSAFGDVLVTYIQDRFETELRTLGASRVQGLSRKSRRPKGKYGTVASDRQQSARSGRAKF